MFLYLKMNRQFPFSIYLFKVVMETPEQCEICSNLTMKIPERCH